MLASQCCSKWSARHREEETAGLWMFSQLLHVALKARLNLSFNKEISLLLFKISKNFSFRSVSHQGIKKVPSEKQTPLLTFFKK